MKQFGILSAAFLICAASFAAFFAPSSAKAADANCMPYDITFVMDNSGSMNDNGADKVLRNKFYPVMRSALYGAPVGLPQEAALILFSYNDTDGVKVPVQYGAASINNALAGIDGMRFGADDSVISKGLRRASKLARARYDTTHRLQIVVVAGDEQAENISSVQSLLTKDGIYPNNGTTVQNQPIGIRYFTFALRPGDNSGPYQKIANWTNPTRSIGEKSNTFFGSADQKTNFTRFLDVLPQEVCRDLSIDGRIFQDSQIPPQPDGVLDTANEPGLANKTVELYEVANNAETRVAQTVTDANGDYHFPNLAPTGKLYRVRPVVPGMTQTTAATSSMAIPATPQDQPIRNFGFIDGASNPSGCLNFQLRPDGQTYYRGATTAQSDTIVVTGTVTNTSANSGQINLTLKPIINTTNNAAVTDIPYTGDSAITPVGAASTTVQSGGARLMTSTSSLNADGTLELTWKYSITNTTNLGSRRLDVDAKIVGCQDTVSQSINFSIQRERACDLQMRIQPTQATVKPTDDIIYTMAVTNAGPDPITGAPIDNYILVPKGLTVVTATPTYASVTSYDATRDKVAWAGRAMPGNQSLNYSATFRVRLTSSGSSPYIIQSRAYFANIGDARCDTSFSNSTGTAVLNVQALNTTKTWAGTTSTTTRQIAPNDTLTFDMKLENRTGATVSGLYLVDYSAVVCDTNYAASCPGPVDDRSITWAAPAGSRLLANGRYIWGPYNLAASGAGSTVNVTMTGRAADAATLTQKVIEYGSQNRCNNLALSDASGNVTGPIANVCWRYELPADVSVSATYLDGSTAYKTLRRGAVEGYILKVTNDGPNTAINTKLIDTITPTSVTPLTRWIDSSVTGTGGTVVTNTKAQWDFGHVASKTTKEVRPQFAVVPCDASTGPVQAITNLAIATTDSRDDRPSNNSNSDLRANIINGHYNLTLTSLTDKYELVRGETGNDTVTVKFTVENPNDPTNPVDMAVPLVRLRAILPLDQFDIVSSDGGQVDGSDLVWDLGDIAKDQKIVKTISLQTKASATAKTSYINVEAVSASASSNQTCGYASDSDSVVVKLPGLYVTKALPAGADPDVELGAPVAYELNVVNNSNVQYTNNFTLVDSLTTPMIYDQVESCTITNMTTSQSVACAKPTPTAGQTVSWAIPNPLPAKSTVKYVMKTHSDASYTPPTCPISVDNIAILKDGANEVNRSTPATVNLYAARCFSGNIYSQPNPISGQTPVGVDIRGSDIIIDSKSIISSSGDVKCSPNNNSCNSVPYKIKGYAVDAQSGSAISYSTLKQRMTRNVDRLMKDAAKLPTQPLNGRSVLTAPNNAFELQGDKAKYPDGRSWVHDGDLTIQTPIKFVGKGTLIVNGDLTIAGTGTVQYCTDTAGTSCTSDGSPSGAVGFLVIGRGTPLRGDVRIEDGVTKLVGAFYAPNGTITFAGNPSSPQLRPAKGIFIAQKFVMDRQKLVVLYDNYLNTAQGAPPGFKFSTSPSETQEGS